MTAKTDCIYFKGDVPCLPHKQEGVFCECQHYMPRGRRYLIIKLGAIGDVIRTTPVVRKLKQLEPTCEITWVTHTPDVLPEAVDVRLSFDWTTTLRLQADEFDVLYNFDKDAEACALASTVKAQEKRGFLLVDGRCAPAGDRAQHKFLTGIHDDYSRANMKSYPEELFEIAGLPYAREKYLMPSLNRVSLIPALTPPVVGLNTGCGGRWTTRLWSDAHWMDLAQRLQADNLTPLLLGGAEEHERNQRIAQASGAHYFGHFPLRDFFAVVNSCDAVVTAVTLALHVAIGLEKKIVLLNNIFNRHEFELYGLGEILEPPAGCNCYFASECREGRRCLDEITPQRVMEAVQQVLGSGF